MIAQLPIEFEKALREKYDAKMLELNILAKNQTQEETVSSKAEIAQALKDFESKTLEKAISQKEKQIAKAQAEKDNAIESKKKEIVEKILLLIEEKMVKEKSVDAINKMLSLLPKLDTIQVFEGAKIPGTKATLKEFKVVGFDGIAEYEVTPKILIQEKRDVVIKAVLEELDD